MTREGDKLILQYEVLDLSAGGSVDVKVYTKTFDQEDSATSQAQLNDSGGSPATLTMNGKGLYELELTYADIKDEVRIRYTGTAGVGVTEWVHVRLLGMIWFDSAT